MIDYRIFIFWLGIITAACSSSKELVVHRAEDASFRGLKTFDIIHDDSVGSPRLLEKLIKKEMDNLGYEYDSLNADFTVGYAGKVNVRRSVQRTDPYMMYGPGWGWGAGAPYYPSYSTYEYLEHVFVVDMIDFKKEQIMWQGSFSERLNNDPKRKDVANAVSAIFRQFAGGRK